LSSRKLDSAFTSPNEVAEVISYEGDISFEHATESLATDVQDLPLRPAICQPFVDEERADPPQTCLTMHPRRRPDSLT
jgi:hypothetical protein